jgi:hypothetical protein
LKVIASHATALELHQPKAFIMASHQASHFFVAESAKLSSLLDVVTAMAAASQDLGTYNRFLELKGIVNELVLQAQHYTLLAPEDLKGRWMEVQLFAGRSQAVKDAVGAMEATRMSDVSNTGCKKRSRSGTVESTSVLKRSRSYQNADEMQMDVVMNELPIRTAGRQHR